ncbi:hypothetical protein DM860_011649 [Cuscuta australis]|uniref:K+ potassium transporter integral membrane domain-containing protein n=1 Tax=Cuscuta australis TaxID=267555 RepID=A0A328DEP5_9ASTE|nr:hypothetical protein DM860_011649 [Cuscuta australis]
MASSQVLECEATIIGVELAAAIPDEVVDVVHDEVVVVVEEELEADIIIEVDDDDDDEEDNEIFPTCDTLQTEIQVEDEEDNEIVPTRNSLQTEIQMEDEEEDVIEEEEEEVTAAEHPEQRISGIKGVGALVLLQLVFQSLGVVYGDMGTSPLYAFPSIFPKGIRHEDDILGVLGLIYYTLTLIPLIKYVCIVLHANYNGEGAVVWITASILVCLFAIQSFGTGRVGFAFAPIVFLWFLAIGTIGIYNSDTYDHSVVKAFLPSYIIPYFIRNTKDAWISLGGVVLTVTGTKALYADVGHFSVLSIRLSLCCVVYPALMLAYTGQAAFLRKHPDLVAYTFFKSTPKEVYWPIFILSVAASIVASQAMISATFSVIKQAVDIGCFPRIPISRPSQQHPGQIYIPLVNYFLMGASLGVTFYFRTTANIGNAYGRLFAPRFRHVIDTYNVCMEGGELEREEAFSGSYARILHLFFIVYI